MTFLGLEQPVAYGRQQVFDPTTAQMVLNANRDYINAVYNDYLQSQQEMKEFNKEYGDFLSPIQKDMEWYQDNVTGRIKNFINNLYSRGIDPLRSSEGRALIRRELATMDTKGIAQVKQSAEAAKEYIKNRGLLQAAGKWDPEFEEFANNGQTLENWDTIGGHNIWTRTSPTELKTLKELTESWYNHRSAHMLDKAGVESFDMQYDPRYDYTGFTKKDLLDIAANQTPGWNGSIYSKYYRDQAKKQLQAAGIENPNAAQIESLLQNNIANANKEYLISPSRSVNQLYLQSLKNALAREEPGPRTFMERIRDNINARQEQQQNINSFGQIANYWNEMARKEESNNSPVLKRELIPGTESKITGVFAPSITGNSTSVSLTTGEPKYKYTYDNSKNNKYKYYISERDRWTRMAQTGDYIVSDRDKSNAANKIREIQKKPYDKRTPEELMFISNYAEQDYTRMMSKVNSNAPAYLGKKGQAPGTTTNRDLMTRSHAWWQKNEATSLSNTAKTVFSNYFYGINDKSKELGEVNENQRVSLSDGSYHYAPITQSKYAGPGRFRHNSIFSKFDRWVTNRQHLFRAGDKNNVRFAELPNAYGGRDASVLAYPQATVDQITEFYKKHGGRYETMADMVKDLGLIPHDEQLSTKELESGNYKKTTYFSIPIIKTGSNFGGQLYRDFNTESNRVEYGDGNAFKMAVDDENQSLIDWQQQKLLDALINQ